MTRWTLRATAALLALTLGIWAGFKVHPGLALHRQIRTAAGESLEPVASGASPGAAQETAPHVIIPDELPDFALKALDGKLTPIGTWRGRALVINFWATWCAPCRREIPLLESLSRDWRSENVEVIGVAVDHRDKVLEFADDLKISYPLLIGEQDALDAATAFGVESPVFPFTVFTDRRGEILTVFVGELHAPQLGVIMSALRSVDDFRITLKAAQRDIAAGLKELPAHPG